MIGKKQIQIDGQNFVQGLSTSDYLANGGMGTSSSNINIVAQPGTIRASGTITPSGDTLTQQFLASCEDGRSSASINRVYLDDDGQWWGASFSTGTVTMILGKTPASSSGYTRGLIDLASFDSLFWATKTTNVVMATPPSGSFSGSWTLDETWWTGTKSQSALIGGAPHPMLVFEGMLWIADGKKLHSVDDSGNVVNGVLQLNDNDVIYALGIDPATGLMLISVRSLRTSGSTGNYLSTRWFVCLYDGYSTKVRRRVPVEDLVTCFQNVGGTVYVGYGNAVGAWNGSGITFLRRMVNINSDTDDLVNKNNMTAFSQFLVVADGVNLLAYGEVVPNQKVWFPIWQNTVDSTDIGVVTSIGNDQSTTIPTQPGLLVNLSGTTTLRVALPMSTTVVGSGIYYSPFINMERPINVRRVRVFTTGITTTAGIGGVGLIDELGVTTTPAVSTFVVAASQSPKRVFDFDFNKQLQALQLKLTLATQAFAITRVVIYYDVIE